jgi:hypothetical protein
MQELKAPPVLPREAWVKAEDGRRRVVEVLEQYHLMNGHAPPNPVASLKGALHMLRHQDTDQAREAVQQLEGMLLHELAHRAIDEVALAALGGG